MKFTVLSIVAVLATPCVVQAQGTNGAAAEIAVSQGAGEELSGETKGGVATATAAVAALLLGLGGGGGTSSSTTTGAPTGGGN